MAYLTYIKFINIPKQISKGEYVYNGLSVIDGRYKEDKEFFIETFAFTEFVF